MNTVPVPPMRATLHESGDELSIWIPTRRRTWFLIYTGFPALLWLFGEMFLLAQLIGIRLGSLPVAFFFLTGWTAMGLPLALPWLWMMFGRELIVVGPRTLTQRYELLPGFGRARHYDLTSVQHLRVSPEGLDVGAGRMWLRMLHVGGGSIAFDYGSRTVRMGVSVDEAEGRVIVERIGRHLPVPTGAPLG